MRTRDGDPLVTLRGGLMVPVEALDLVVDLELRQGADRLEMTVEGETLRVWGPDRGEPELSAGDAEDIRRWKRHILALLAYRVPAGEGPRIAGEGGGR